MSLPEMAVPPRRGQRIKSTLLPPFNGGNAFALVKCGERIGIVHRRVGSQTAVWFEYDLIPTKCDNRDLTPLTCTAVPCQAYEEYQAVIGGVGKHLRWKVIMRNKKLSGPTQLRITQTNDVDEFCKFVRNNLEPLAHSPVKLEGGEIILPIPDVQNVGIVAAALHCAGYEARVDDAQSSCGAKLAIERYDRSEHMWWNQEQNSAGPLRDVHRWVYDFIPTHWKKIPFTWQSLCSNIDSIDPVRDAPCLPRPLRDYYITSKIAEAETAGDRAQVDELTKLRGDPAVTCRLSEAQNRQLLQVTYWCLIAPFKKMVDLHMCKLIRFRYMLHGYMGREIGEYRQNASNLGHGATIREFKNKPQYQPKNLASGVLNRIYRSDGSMRGSGFKGTRGKYGHKDFPKYVPSKRMRRTVLQEKRVRLEATNPFQHYSDNNVTQEAHQTQ
jgi:hypothetical protein